MEIAKNGLKINNKHKKTCGAWQGVKCDCWLGWDLDGDYTDKWGIELEEDIWELENEEPPIRTSKTAKPKHGVDGRSIFTIWDKARGK